MTLIRDEPVWVLTADQVGSRSGADRVPDALTALALLTTERAFERTAGDEIQGVLADGEGVVAALRVLVRLDGWRVGVGGGGVEHPLPASTRAGRGPAFIAARAALGASRRAPGRVAVRVAEGGVRGGGGLAGAGVVGDGSAVGRDGYGREQDPETLLWLLADLWRRRSREGWQVVDLFADGLNGQDAARALGITPSAVSQRAAAARWVEGGRAEELAARLLDTSLLPPEEVP